MNRVRQHLNRRGKGAEQAGLLSICSANLHVIRAAMRSFQAARFPMPLLIEATANRVDQNGGYTGMTPECFRLFVLSRLVGLT